MRTESKTGENGVLSTSIIIELKIQFHTNSSLRSLLLVLSLATAYNQKIDVYSYGIVLWELFCFRKPYKDEDPVKLPYKVALDNKRPPLAPHIPQKFAALMEKCWAADPKSRPEMDEVLRILQDFTKSGEEGSNVDLDAAVDVMKIR